MDQNEAHERTMNLNAHMAWAFALLGSAEIANERGNSLCAAIAYYYSAFHAGVAWINTDYTFHLEDMKRIKHSKVESWLENRLPQKLHEQYWILRELREVVNYLGMETPAKKLQVVRGHPFGFEIKALTMVKRMSFFDLLAHADKSTKAILDHILSEIETHCAAAHWRGPKHGDDEWLMEYLQGDLMLNVLPEGPDRGQILLRGFAMVSEPN